MNTPKVLHKPFAPYRLVIGITALLAVLFSLQLFEFFSLAPPEIPQIIAPKSVGSGQKIDSFSLFMQKKPANFGIGHIWDHLSCIKTPKNPINGNDLYLLCDGDPYPSYVGYDEEVFVQMEKGKLRRSVEKGALSLQFGEKIASVSLVLDGKTLFDETSIETIKKTKQTALHPSLTSIYQKLSKALLLPPDQLLLLYGGEEYQEKKGAYRLFFPEEGLLFFLKKGETISLDLYGCSLRLEEKEGKEGILLFSESGFSALSFPVRKQEGSLPSLQGFTAMRKKSRTMISLSIDKTKRVLQRGDWLLQVDGKWRTLDQPTWIDDIIHLKMQTPLLIIDGIEERSGKSIVIAHCFDPLHTQSKEVQWPLQEGVKQKMNPKVVQGKDS